MPSGKALAEFALQAGFLAPLLLRADRFGKAGSKKSSEVSTSAITASPATETNAGQARNRHFEKGESR